MADSLLTSLLNMIDRRGIAGVAGALGEPEQSVQRGTEASIATVLGGLAAKADEPIALRKILDMAPTGDITPSQIISSVSDSNSPLLSAGKRLLSTLFGSNEGTVLNAVSSDAGLPSGKTATI